MTTRMLFSLTFAILSFSSDTIPAKPLEESACNQAQPPGKQAASPVAAPNPIKVVPNSPNAKEAIEAAIRNRADKPTGELTKADLEKVRKLNLIGININFLKILARLTNLNELDLGDSDFTYNNQITDLTPLAGLTELRRLDLKDNPNLTKADIDKLQKALPKCLITHNATK